MSTLTKKRAACYLVTVFLVSATAGALGGYCFGVRKAFAPQGQKQLKARMTEIARSRLHLTDDQLRQIQPILDETAAEMQSVSVNTLDRINDIILKANQRITPFLTAEQKVLLKNLEDRRQELFRKAAQSEDSAR